MARLANPSGIAVDAAGNLYIADGSNRRIRRIDPVGTITTVAGNGALGFSGDNGPATAAALISPSSVALDAAGNLYIADATNHRIRQVDPSGTITTVAGNGSSGFSGDNGSATEASLTNPAAVALDAAGNLYVADQGNQRIRRVDTAGTITTVAGNGTPGFSGDNGPATAGSLAAPFGVALDVSGNLYIADRSNQRIRRVDPSGTITTVAGNGVQGFSGDNGPATAAALAVPLAVALDAAGNLYIADSGNHRVRRVDPAGKITTVAGTGTAGFSGDNGPAAAARLNDPTRIALDAAGNLYIADRGNQRIRRVDTGGTIATVAGTGTAGFSGDNGPATAARLADPFGVALDLAANLYIADRENRRIRRVGPAGPSVDATPPTVAANVAGTSGTNGWYRSDVTVTWTVTDPDSPILALNGCGAISITADTSGQTLTCSATSGGGTTTESVTIKRDTTRPTSIATPLPAPNANGWNNTDVVVTFSGDDGATGSGIATCTAPRVLTTEGLHSGVQGFCTDVAGNSSSNTAVAPNIRIDKTAPSVVITTPAAGATYPGQSTVIAAYQCNDSLSSITGCIGPVLAGAAIDTASPGAKSFAVTGTDAAGNTATVTRAYTVTALPVPVIAIADSGTTLEDQPLTIAVLGNDTGGVGPLSLVAVTQGANGTVSIVGTTAQYVPAANFYGSDSFTYTAGDGATTSTATVSITITPVNDPPLAANDTATTDESVVITIAVLANDSDLDGDTLTVSAVGTSANASITTNGTTVTYAPNVDFSGTDTFSYTAFDGQLSSTATLTVTVADTVVGIPGPIAYYPLDGSGDEVTGRNIDLNPIGGPQYSPSHVPGFGTAVDIDGTDDGLVGKGFTASLTGDLTISAWVLARTLESAGTIVKNWASPAGQFHFGLDIPGNALENFVWTNGNTQVRVVDDTAFPVDRWVHVAVVVRSSDLTQTLFIDGSPTQTASILSPLSSGGVDALGIGIKPNEAGTGAWDPFSDWQVWDGLIDDVTIWDQALTTAQLASIFTEGQAGRTIGQLTTQAPHAPIANDDAVSTENGVPVSINVLANDTDPDGDPLSIVSFTEPASGQVVREGSGFRYTPNASGNKCTKQADSFSYTVTDGTTTDTGVVRISFIWPNQRPIALAGGPAKVYEGESIQLVGGASNDPDGDLISYHWSAVSPSTYSFGSGDQNPTVPAPPPGEYTFALRVFDCTYPAHADGQSAITPQSNVTVIVEDLPELSIDDVQVLEGNSGTQTAQFPVHLSKVSDREIAISYQTVAGTATAGSDFSPIQGVLTFPPGSTEQSIGVPILGDTSYEPNEQFSVTVSGPSFVRTIDGSATGTIQNDDQSPERLMTVAPAVLGVRSFSQGQFTVTVALPAGPGGLVVSLQPTPAGLTTIPATVTVPEGQTSASVSVTTGAVLGSGTVLVTAGGYDPATLQLNVTARTGQVELVNTLIGVGRTTVGQVVLDEPAPSTGVPVTLTSTGAGAVTIAPSSVTVAAGLNSADFVVTGVGVGDYAIAGVSPGFALETGNAFVTSKTIAIGQVPTLGVGQSASLLVSLSESALTDTTVTLTSSNPAVATVPASVVIPAGSTQPAQNAQVTGVAPGTAAITATAAGFASESRNVTVQMGLSVDPASITLHATRAVTVALRLSAPAPTGGFPVSLTVDDSGVAGVSPSQLVVPQGQLSAQFTVTGLTAGNTSINASATGATSASASVTVLPPAKLCISSQGCGLESMAVRIGEDLQLGFNLSLETVPPTGQPADISVASQNEARVRVSSVENALGNGPVNRVGVSTNQPQSVWIQALDGAVGTTTNVVVSAPGYSSITIAVQVDPSGFVIGSPGADFATNTGATNTQVALYAMHLQPGTLEAYSIGEVRGGLVVPVQVTSSNPAVGTITPQTVSAQNTADGVLSNGGSAGVTAFDPNNQGAGGTTTIAVVAPAGFETLATEFQNANRDLEATVSAARICHWNQGCVTGQLVPIGADLQLGFPMLLESPPDAPVDIEAISSDPSVLRVSTAENVVGGASVTVENVADTSVVSFWVQALGTAQGSTAQVTFRATGYSDTVWTFQVDPSGFVIGSPGADFATNTGATDTQVALYAMHLQPGTLEAYSIGEVRGGLVVPVQVTSSNPAVGTITPQTVSAQNTADGVLSNGGSAGVTAFDPNNQGAGGTTTIAVVAPAGFETLATEFQNANRDLEATVSAARICHWNQGCVTGQLVPIGADLQLGFPMLLESPPDAPVDIEAISSDPSVLRVSTAENVVGGASVTVENVADTSVVSFWVQALGTAQGSTAQVTFRATGYSDTVWTFQVDPSGFVIGSPGADFATNTGATDTQVALYAMHLQPGTLEAYSIGEVRGGLVVPVQVTSSNPAVGTITPQTVSAQNTADGVLSNGGSAGVTAFDPNNQGAGGTTTIAVVAPAGFETLATEFQNANRDLEATVSAARICHWNQGCVTGQLVPIGADLQLGFPMLLESPPDAPVDIEAISSDPSVLRVSTAENVVGGASVTVENVADTSVVSFWVQALGTAQGSTAQVTFRATGYSDTVWTFQVDPSGFVIGSPGADFATNTGATDTQVALYAMHLQPGTLEAYSIGEVRGGLVVPVQVTSSNPAVGTITPQTVSAQNTADGVLSNGGSAGVTAFDPNNQGAGGTTTIAVVAPAGFETLATEFQNANRDLEATVNAPAICVNNYGCSSSVIPFSVGEDLQLQISVSLEIDPGGSVALRARSNDFGVAVVSGDELAGGQQQVEKQISGTDTVHFWIQGLSQGQATTVTLEVVDGLATPFATRTIQVEVDPSGFVTTTDDFSRAADATDVPVVVYAARLSRTDLSAAELQEIRGGYTAAVMLESDNEVVGRISSPLPIVVQSIDGDPVGGVSIAGQALFEPLSAGETAIEVVPPAGWDVPKTGVGYDRFVIATVTP